MKETDYSKCTIEELNDVLRHIDREAYPEKVLDIEHNLKLKLADPELVEQESYKSNFFNLHIPSGLVTSIWLRLVGWGLVFNLVAMVPIILISVLLGAFGAGEYWVKSISTVLAWLVSIAVGWVALRKALGAKLENYEVSIIKKEN